MASRSAPERGAASLELVILAPIVFAVLSLLLVFGRYAETENTVDQAARDGARSATAQNSAADAEQIAVGAAQDAMAGAPDSCKSSMNVDFRPSAGAYEGADLQDLTEVHWVAVEVSCTVDLTDLGPLPLQEVDITQTFTSPIDRYRGYAQ